MHRRALAAVPVLAGLLVFTALCHAQDVAPPAILSIVPAPGSVVSNLTRVTVTFTEPVAGAQAADLILNNDAPAGSASSTGAVVVFEFTQPPTGLVLLSFDPDAVVTDLSGNAFDPLSPQASWSYTLADTIAPAVARAVPAPGATVRSFTGLEVVFTEPVSGVDAADVRINGQPAASCTPLSELRYRFDFPTPPPGPVTISWAGGHGIQDLAAAPNAFAGPGWNYTLNSAAPGDLVINEILADNLNGLVDEDGQKQDWIELHNRGAAAVNLLGWSLTDDPANPGRWTFPALTLGSGQYLVVFASGKNRTPTAPGTTNHTSFRLSPNGGYIGLFGPELPRSAVSELGSTYPEQRGDIAYGRVTGGGLSYFSTPTPGAANSAPGAVSGFAQPPHASVKSGLFSQPFNLVLSTETPGAEIRYTLDGKPPTATNALYTGPLPVAGTPTKAVVMIRAAAFKPGLLPSLVTTRTYIFPEHVLTQPTNPAGFPGIWDSPCTGFNNCNDISPADYEMDPQVITNTVDNYRALALQGLAAIPTVSIVTDVNLLFGAAEGVYVRREPFLRKPVSAEFIPADGREGFQIDCGLEMQGQTSPDDSTTGGIKWKSLKLGLRLFFQGEFGATKLRYKVFEDSPVEEFDTLMLGGGHNNYWNYNNNDTQRIRALYVRDQYVADLQNALGGRSHHGRFVHLYLNGLYWGLYQMHERPDESFQASYFGGDRADYDVFKHDAVTPANVVAGSVTSYTAMWTVINAGLTNNAGYEQVQQVLDVPGLVDYLLINFWANNSDWDHKNFYASRRRPDGKWRFHAWDSEHVLASTDFAVLDDNNGTNPTALFRRLLANAEFRVLFGDRIHRHFFNDGIFYVDPANTIYNPAFPERNPAAHRFSRMLLGIDTAIVCESARWGDVGPGRETTPHTRNLSFYEERDILFGNRATFGAHSPVFFPSRSTNLLAQFRTRGWYPATAAPRFSRHGGQVAAGYALYITNLAAGSTVYYTTNGTDPRVYGSGAVSPQALAYAGVPATLLQSTVVKARARLGTNWSALNEATFTVGPLGPPVRLTEFMYHPPDGDAHEFLELYHAGVTPLDLGGWHFEGINFVFPPGFELAPGARLVLANNTDPASFALRYPGVQVAGWFGGSLDDGGERLALRDSAGQTVWSVDYDNDAPWPQAAAGGGASLEVLDLQGDPDDPANWRASTVPQGTPGQAASLAPATSIVLNEIMADNVSAVAQGGGYPDWVELRHAGGTPVNLTGWSLTDNGNPRRFVFTNGPILNPGDYLVVWCDTNTAAPGWHTGFGLDRDGAIVALYDAATNRVDAITLGAQLADYSVGRVGGEWRLTSPSPGALNSAAATAPASALVLNEWLANAAPGSDDWIELHNTSGVLPVALRGLHLASSNALHRLTALAFIRAGGFLQLLADEQPGPRHLDFTLPATGGTLVLSDAGGIELNRVTYGAQAEGVSQGRFPDAAVSTVAFPGSASPGASNYLLANSGVLLNELLARNLTGEFSPWGTRADWIELANTNVTSRSLAGLGLSDRPGGPKWIVPTGVTIAGAGQVRFWCDADQPASTAAAPALNTGFALSAAGGGLYLYATNGQILDYVEYGPQAEDHVIGRVSTGAWLLLSAPTPGAPNAPAAALAAPASLRFNEWLSNPGRGGDWFELCNTNTLPLSLGGLHLTDDPSVSGRDAFTIAPLSFLAPRGFLRFQADGDPSQGRDHVNFNLDDLGDSLRLYDTNFALLDNVEFGPLALDASEGRLPDGSGTVIPFPSSSTPGAPNRLPVTGVVLNEILARPGAAMEDAIELYNTSAQAIPLGGWFLSDSTADLRKFRIPDGTLLAGGAYRVFYATQFNTGGPGSFALDGARGGTVYLSEADGAGNLTGFRTEAAFGPAEAGVSAGRISTCAGPRFAALAGRSLGEDAPVSLEQFRTGSGLPNPGARVEPVVINEIHYHPTGGAGTLDEFIELANVGNSAVAFQEPAAPASAWTLRGGVTFAFPTNLSLAPGGFALIVGFDPLAEPTAAESFRARFLVPANVPILGPWTGELANDGEALELTRPGTPLTAPEPGPGFVPRLVVDRVEYGQAAPWPENADGFGASLQRRSPTGYGDDPGEWVGSLPTAGHLAPAQPVLAPTILEHPLGRVAALNSRVLFSVAVCGTPPFTYQWRRNGSNLPGATNPSLVLPSATAGDAGTYTVVVANTAGQGIGGPAELILGQAPAITQQPAGTNLPPGGTLTLTVTATGTGPLLYQWRLNGLPLPGATNATYSVTNAQPTNTGLYSVLVGNGVGSVLSAAAMVSLVIPPSITEQPAGAFVRVPPDPLTSPTRQAVFRVTATTINPPLAYRWRFNGVPLDPGAPGFNGVLSNVLTLTNVQFSHGGDYDCLLTDAVTVYPSATGRLVPVITPFVIQATTNSMTNVVSSTVTLSATIFGSPPPFTYIWRSNSAILRAVTTTQTNDFMTFGTPPAPGQLTYRVEVTNYSAILFNFTNRLYFTNYIVGDSDADGLPDYYELAFGDGFLNPGDDDDHDGMTNLQEYLAGTDPTDAQSYLRLDSIASGPGAILAFGAVANRTYTIQFAPAPSGGPWSNLVHVTAAATNRVETIIDPTPGPRRFYRAVTPRQP